MDKGPFAKREEEILAFWNKEKIFEKSLNKPAPKGEFIFYDGPPFATGLPHYGHVLPTTIKDAIPRYRTMTGWHVARRWGWDCHGLPLENQIEQELGFKTKRDIERFGIKQFNEAARAAVLRYAEDWKQIIPRMGRWVDMEHDYKTMDATYTESVWWAFKNLHRRGLIYEGFKAMQLCPRCGTTLSNFEVAQGYQDIQDITVTVKFHLKPDQKFGAGKITKDTAYILAWTTTPWTLPGNTALAVGKDFLYTALRVRGVEELYIVAKNLLPKVFANKEIEIVHDDIPGSDLVGLYYDPPFSYFKEELHKHKTHAWRVYAASFVTLDSGTGIVHIAPAFGEDDLALAQKEKIPLIHHVTDEGKFIATVTDFAHLPVKPKGRHMETDAKIVEYLKSHGLLFAEEKITHSYPHCWRCDTPLLNWAANSWFVAVAKLKGKLLAQNKKVAWVPERIGTGRFQNGLASAPDWAISRTRYWGAPVPVWRHSKTKEIKVVGSVEDLLSMVRRSGNTYVLMRHGEARHNVEGLLHSDDAVPDHLTEQGREDVERSVRALGRTKKIDLIITSPLERTRETALIAQKVLGLPNTAVMADERLRETGTGEFNNRPLTEWRAFFGLRHARFQTRPPGGESYADVRKRVGEFLFDIEHRYSGKSILFVTHGDPGWLMREVALRTSMQALKERGEKGTYPELASYYELPFVLFPHNDDYELDLHRPYIDEVALGDSLSGTWQRVPDVFDCWFESGSMPFASNHYPFAKKHFDPKGFFGFGYKGFPADFISESIDQTRGWFYSLIVLGVGLFGRSPYTHVITNGTVLAEDGRKMSKRLKNYPDVSETIDRFGADALRYFLLSSSVIRGEDVKFSLRGVEEVSKKLLMRLDNVQSFYALYADQTPRSAKSTHALDRWILSRVNELIRDTAKGFECYELDVASRPLAQFIDDLSVWYLRRSRNRFRVDGEEKQHALATLRFVLYRTAQVMAPTMPFFAEELYLKVKEDNDAESVHLTTWPSPEAVDEQLLRDMAHLRVVASKGLELRERSGIKIRQPLALLKAKQIPADPELQAILAEEVNVKTVAGDATLTEDVWLDTELTPALKEEGLVRDLIRRVQEWRKEQKFTIADRPSYTLIVSQEEAPVAQKHTEEIMAATGLESLDIHA